MADSIGELFIELGARVNRAGFDKFDREVKQAQRQRDITVEAKLKPRHADFKRWKAYVAEANKAHVSVQAKLEVQKQAELAFRRKLEQIQTLAEKVAAKAKQIELAPTVHNQAVANYERAAKRLADARQQIEDAKAAGTDKDTLAEMNRGLGTLTNAKNAAERKVKATANPVPALQAEQRSLERMLQIRREEAQLLRNKHDAIANSATREDYDLDGLNRAIVDLRLAEQRADAYRRALTRLDRAVGKGSTSLKLFGIALASTAILGFTALLGTALRAVAALAAGIISLTSALAPLSGLLASGAQAFSMFAQFGGVAVFALRDLTAALGGNKEAQKRLTDQGWVLYDALQPIIGRFRDLRDVAQNSMFEGMVSGLRKLEPFLDRLEPVIRITGRALGGFAERVGELLGSDRFGRNFDVVTRNNVTLFNRLSSAFLTVANSLMGFMAAAGPLTDWLGETIQGWADLIDAEVVAGQESGRLTDFFDHTRRVLEQVFDIVGNVGEAFLNIGRVAAPAGRELMASLEGATGALADWTGGAGESDLASFFNGAVEPLREMGRLLRDVALEFMDMVRQPGLTELIEAVRTELLPALGDLVQASTTAFGPQFITALTSIVELFTTLAPALGQFAEAIAWMADAISRLVANNPAVGQFLVFMAGLGGIMAAANFASKVFGIRALGKAILWLNTVAKSTAVTRFLNALGMTNATAGTRRIGILRRAFSGLTGVFVRVGAAAVAALAPIAGPVALAAAVIVGLGILIYKNWDKIKAQAKRAWDGVVSIWRRLPAALGQSLRMLGGMLARPFVNAYNTIKDLVGKIKQLWDNLKNLPREGLEAGKNAIQNLGNKILPGNPFRARGGRVDQPTIIAGEDGEEIVVPVSAKYASDGKAWLSVAAEKLGGEVTFMARGGSTLMRHRDQILKLQRQQERAKQDYSNLDRDVRRDGSLDDNEAQALRRELRRLRRLEGREAQAIDRIIPEYRRELGNMRGVLQRIEPESGSSPFRARKRSIEDQIDALKEREPKKPIGRRTDIREDNALDRRKREWQREKDALGRELRVVNRQEQDWREKNKREKNNWRKDRDAAKDRQERLESQMQDMLRRRRELAQQRVDTEDDRQDLLREQQQGKLTATPQLDVPLDEAATQLALAETTEGKEDDNAAREVMRGLLEQRLTILTGRRDRYAPGTREREVLNEAVRDVAGQLGGMPEKMSEQLQAAAVGSAQLDLYRSFSNFQSRSSNAVMGDMRMVGATTGSKAGRQTVVEYHEHFEREPQDAHSRARSLASEFKAYI